MNSVYISGGLRTFIGAKNKIYKNVPVEKLASCILKKLWEDSIEKGQEPDAVIFGNATCGGGNIARLSLLTAGLKDSVAGISVDAQCASGLESVISGWTRIKAGINSAVIAGGAESASTRCIRSLNPNHPAYDSSKESNEYQSAQFIPEILSDNSMIYEADETCRKYKIDSEQMISFVLRSHQAAARARDSASLNKVIFPCFGAQKDELIRESMTENFIRRLRPVLENGIINSATSCLFSDGAAFVTLSRFPADLFGSGHCFKIKAVADTGSNRFYSPESLIEVIKKLIKVSGVEESAIERIDYNQAFGCVDVLYGQNFSKPSNIYGGALAYGHPYGASGIIVLLHLLCAMEENNEKYGIAAIPAAGGVASAVLIERCTL